MRDRSDVNGVVHSIDLGVVNDLADPNICMNSESVTITSVLVWLLVFTLCPCAEHMLVNLTFTFSLVKEGDS